MISQISRLME